MENLNAEEVKEWLEICADDTPYPNQRRALIDAIALIKSYEDKIFALENRLKECENGYEGTLFFDRCKLHDAEEKVKKLTEENEKLTINMNAYGLTAKRLVEDNERLRAESIDYRNIPYIIAEAKADTVRKMQKRLRNFFTNDDILRNCEIDAKYVNAKIDRIAKKMLEILDKNK